MSAPVTREARLETEFGAVKIHSLEWEDEPPYVVLESLRRGEVTPRLRVQAQCLTSTAFRSTMCDCGEQIDAGVEMCATESDALMVYMPQEGRGHGIHSKVEIMAQMNRGLTLEAAQREVGRPDSRLSYRRVPEILAYAGITGPLRVVTASVAKLDALRTLGITVDDRTSLPGRG